VRSKAGKQNQCSIFAAIAAVFTLFSCEQASVGLGAKVDIYAPIVKMSEARGPVPGSFISGVQRMYISATDDGSVKSVQLTYTYRVLQDNGKMAEQPPVTLMAQPDSVKDEYFVDIDTITGGMADGSLVVELTAIDNSDRLSKSERLIYTVKNAPPALDVQVPRPRARDGILNNTDAPEDSLPVVVTDTYILGVFQDLAGVARTYPQIQLWADPDGRSPPPLKDAGNAGWEQVTLDDGADDGWINVDQGLVESDDGEKGNTLRYYLRAHNAGGTPVAEQSGAGLPQGKYSLRVKLRDIMGKELLWPQDSYENRPDRIRLELLAAGTPPLITIDGPGNLYQRGDFAIKARAEPRGDNDTDIGEMAFEIIGKDRAGGNSTLILKRWTAPDMASNVVKSFNIQVGKTYYSERPDDEARVVDDEAQVPASAFSFITFKDGSYNFTVRASSLPTGAASRETLALYIDRSPPAVSVTELKPFFDEETVEGANPYRRWTVNGTIKISVSSTDNRGNALDEEGRMKFKYLLLKDTDGMESGYASAGAGKTFGDYLFERPEAVYFDETKDNPVPLNPAVPGNANPLAAVSGGDGTYTLTLQTQYYDSRETYPLWFYIVSQDNAGNTSYSRVLIEVDQKTDNPALKFGSFNQDASAPGLNFADETTSIRLDLSDDDGLDPASLEYRFSAERGGSWKPWISIPLNASGDMRSLTVSSLSLKTIYRDLAVLDGTVPADFDNAGDEDRLKILGSEMDTKAIQARIRDDRSKKVLETDEVKTGESPETLFTMDLSWPKIIPSATDNASPANPISRNDDDPFVDPRKDQAYPRVFTAYGDLDERNLKSFTAVIDGQHRISFSVPDSIPGSEPPQTALTDNSLYALNGTGQSERPVPAVWKTQDPWKGGLRWRFPLDYEVPAVFDGARTTEISPAYKLWDELGEGPHTLMIQAEDKVPRTVSKQISFYKDSRGPAINLITLNEKVYLSDEDLGYIEQNANISADLQNRYNKIKDMTIKENEARIIGAFTDEFSAVNSHFWYRIDGGPWHKKSLGAAGKTAAWELIFTSSADGELGDGLHRLSIRVADSLGNGHGFGDLSYAESGAGPANGPGSETNIGFILDREEPELEITAPYADKDTTEQLDSYSNGVSGSGQPVFRLGGLVSDSSLHGQSPLTAVSDAAGNPALSPVLNKINWLGRPAAAPASPHAWDAYYDILEGRSKYWDGHSWNLLNPLNPAYEPAGGNVQTWLWSLEVDENLLRTAFPEEKRFSIIITARDSADRKVTKAWNFIKDNTPPSVELINGNPGNAGNPVIILEENPKIRGAVLDAQGKVAGVKIKLERSVYDAAAGNPPYRWEVIQSNGKDWEDLGLTANSALSFSKDLGTPGSGGLLDGTYRITVSAWDNAVNAANRVETPAFEFVLDRNSPVLTGESLVNSFYNKTFDISGKVAEINGVTMSAKLDSADIGSGNITVSPSGAGTYNWTVTVPLGPALAEASHTVTVTASDPAGRISTAVYNFTYDKTPPSAAFSAPGAGLLQNSGSLTYGEWSELDSAIWVNGIVDIRGSADDKNGVASIFYHLGKLPGNTEADYNAASWTDTLLQSDQPLTGWTGGLYSWTFTSNFNAYETMPGAIERPGTGPSFYLPLYIKVLDEAGNTRILRYNIWVDPNMDRPQVSISSPSSGATVGGEVRVSGTAQDDDWIHHVEIRVIDKSKQEGEAGYYYKDDNEQFLYGENPADSGDSGWLLAHIAGNTDRLVAWYYTINTDGLLNPQAGTSRPVEIEVRAVDTQDDLHQNPMITGSAEKIPLTFDSNIPVISNIKVLKDNKILDYTAGIRMGGEFTISADIRDEGGISSIKARETRDAAFTDMLTSAKSSWTVNKPEERAQTEWEPGLKYCLTDAGTISNWEDIDADWVPGKVYRPGLMFRYKTGGVRPLGAGTAYQAKGSPAGSYNDPAWDSQYFEYHVSVNVRSTDFYGYGETGNYTLDLQATDNNSYPAPYTTAASFNIMVDNYYPTARFTTQYNASTANFYISGTAQDTPASGNIMGLAQVLVYFERGGVYRDAKGASFSVANYPQGKEEADLAGASPNGIAEFPGTLSNGTWTYHATSIDRTEGNSDTDGDGIIEYFDGITDKTWGFPFDTTMPIWTDGPITIHYVIMDQAGNATHYTQDIYIRNNPPLIREFSLGTDLDGDGQIEPSREYNGDPFIIAAIDGKGSVEEDDDTVISVEGSAVQTGFTVRNKRLLFDLNTFGGNGRKSSRVAYVDEGGEVNSTELKAGEVYTIKTSGNTIWTRLGAPDNKPGTTFTASVKAPALTSDGKETQGVATSYIFKEEITYNFTADSSRPSGYSDKAQVLFAGSDFDQITDSLTSPKQPLARNRFFIIKVYDSTVTGGGENEQLAHAVLINMDVDNLDETPPEAWIDPFYWNNSGDNSLYNNDLLNGHIELEADLPAAFSAQGTGLMDRDPKVSGRISIRGTASDNAMLKKLWVYMEDFNFGGNVVTKTVNGRTYVLAAEHSGGGTWQAYSSQANDDWRFSVDAAGQVYNNSQGHIVNWRLDINTAKISMAAAADRAFRILAQDGNPNDSGEQNSQTGASKTPYYQMDVVPYITEIETRLSAFNRAAPSVYARTSGGNYAVAENDTIAVYGFNLGSSPVISLDGTPFDLSQAVSGSGAGSRSSWQFVRFGIGSSVSSGALSLAVNGLVSLNNRNDNSAEYNQQPNGVNNNILTDDTALDVWQFTEAFKARSEARYPVMKVGPQGQIGFSFANDYLWFNMPGYKAGDAATPANFWSQTVYQKNYGGYSHNTFAFDAAGNTYGAALNIDEAESQNNSANFTFMNRWPKSLPNQMSSEDNYNGALNYMRLETTTSPSNPAAPGNYIVDVNRIQSPVMVTSMNNPGALVNNGNNRVNVYLAYYDRTTGQVRFRAGNVGANSAAAAGSSFAATVEASGWIHLPNHGLRPGDQVYLVSDSGNVKGNIDSARPYYVANNAGVNLNYFAVTETENSPSIKDISSRTGTGTDPVTVIMAGGGLADLDGYNTGRVINAIDARPDNYQTVAASGAYNPNLSITHTPRSGLAYSTRYPTAAEYEYGPGNHVAIGVIKDSGNDVVVLAWYDEVNNQLVYSWNNNPAGNSAAQWQANAQVIEDYAGEGVSLATDSDGGIHLSYYSANGADLKYAYAPSYAGSFEAVTVDAYLSVGTHSTITVGKDSQGRIVPYISYYAIGAAALRAKLAYRNYEKDSGGIAQAGVDSQDRFTGAWEVGTVPSTRVPTEYRISVGLWTDGSGAIQALPANQGGTKITGSPYPGPVAVDPPTRLYGNGTLNPVVGYGTTVNLEMAQKK
jgi:hypothetical protein